MLGQRNAAGGRQLERGHRPRADPDGGVARAYGGIPDASLSVVHDQELVWAKGCGYAHVEREEPATASTMYSICSISKLFTAVGVLQLRRGMRESW